VRLSLRAKTVLLLSALMLAPVGVTVWLLIGVNKRPVRTSEQHLQSALVNEVVQESMRPLLDVEQGATEAAAVFSQAAAGTIHDEDAIAAVRALVAIRESVGSLRLEVPAVKLSTVIQWKSTAEVVPESTPELRAIADAKEIAISVAGPTRGLVVVRIKAPPGSKAPPGYVTVRADLDRATRSLENKARQRFGGDMSIVLATYDRKLVAAWGVPDVAAGDDIGKMAVWRLFPDDVPVADWSYVTEFQDGENGMVGAVQTVADPPFVVASFRRQSVAYAALGEMRQQGLLVAAVAALLAVLFGLLAAGGVTAPILRIVGQARLIAGRRWREVSLGSTRSDEIGELTRSLGEMARDLEQGENEVKLRGDLSRFMSRQLVDAIVKGEHPLSLGGKRTAVSVVFADVVGFTPLAEARDAEQIVALLNELFSVLTEIVFRHGGTVDKFIGDCIMAVWGAPVAQEDHAARALGAAEDMMRFLETANEGWREKYDVEIRLGIGVNSGEAIVGNIGSDKRMEYTVIGDVVNVAARLEAIAQPNQVLVAASTRDLVGDAFALTKLGDRKLTGRKTETAVYALDVE
jgi:adenylate cyclase